MKHLQRIDEFLVSKTYEWVWTRKGPTNWTASFDTEDDEFEVDFDKAGPFEPWDLSFSSARRGYNHTDNKGPATAMKILFTVFLDIMVYFLDLHPGEEIAFYGSMGPHDTDKSNTKRDRVYKMLMKDLPEEFWWTIEGRSIVVGRKSDK